MTEILTISNKNVIGAFSPKDAPVAACESGDKVTFDCRNCYDDRLMADGTVIEPEKSIANPATGPLFVNGAKPGDVLKVEILNIELKGKGYMRQSLVCGAFKERYTERRVKEYDVSGSCVQFNDKLSLPIRTMIGVIGTAPAEGELSTEVPGDCGSNMDCKEIVVGSTLYLPVNVEGALLSMGDMHALMGDGESLVCGLESAGWVTVKVSVVKGWKLPTPFLVHQGGKTVSTIQSDPDLYTAAKKACNCMLDFLTEYTTMDDYDGGRLLSLKGNLAICHIINDSLTVRMELDTSILDAYGVKLP